MDFGHHLRMSHFRENSMNQAVYTDILSKGLTTLLRFFKSLFPYLRRIFVTIFDCAENSFSSL